MKIAVMQPYFFPHLAYFQLINAVNKFIVYDDVNYINRGWINRNNILLDGKPFLITLPVSEASQNKKIYEITIATDRKAIDKLLRTLSINYKKAPYFEPVYELIIPLFRNNGLSIAEFNLLQLEAICKYLNITTQIQGSSKHYGNTHLTGAERIVDICTRESANGYVNPIGGVELYDRKLFKGKGVELLFLKPLSTEYTQYNHPFVAGLSIIDVMMFNSVDTIAPMLKLFQLI